jgi:hypothetical protein
MGPISSLRRRWATSGRRAWTVPHDRGAADRPPLEPVEDQVEREPKLALVDSVRYLKQGHLRGKDVIAI